MTWAKLDDAFPNHPKVVELSDRLFRLHVTAICYCAKGLTDGEVPAGALRRLLRGTPRQAQALVDAGLWEVNGDGWAVHDYLKYNPSSAQVEELRRQRAEAGSLGGQASAEAKAQASAEPSATENSEKKAALAQPRYPLPVDPGPGSPSSVSSEAELPPPPASGDAVQRFYQATKANEQVAALVDYARQNGKEISGGRAAAWVRDHQKTAVMTALADGIARNAAGLEDYVTKELGNAKSGRDTSRWAKPEGARNPESTTHIYTAEEYEAAQREVQASGAGDGPKAQPGP